MNSLCRFDKSSAAIRLALFTLLLFAVGCSSYNRHAAITEPVVFGVLADVQYADKATGGARHYRTALQKLEECVTDMNKQDPVFVIQLGDIVDGHHDNLERSAEDLDRVISVFDKLEAPVYHVVGNHCLVAGEETVRRKLELKKFYYDFTVPSAQGWRFIVLDGNDAGYGVIGNEQLEWFRSELDKASKNRERIICFCHFALLENAAAHHRMDKPGPVLQVMDEAGCVAAWFAGHDHTGGYCTRKGVHHVTLTGMVEAPVSNAYALIELQPGTIQETGYGKEPIREMELQAK
jgi:hypothetical protein